MSDVRDPINELPEGPEPETPVPDKKIVFGIRKPTEEASTITGLPLIIEAPFPYERTLRWFPEGRLPDPVYSDAETGAISSDEPASDNGDSTEKNRGELRALAEPDTNTAVIVSQEVLLKVNEHASQSLERELGGFLLGNRYRCPNTPRDYVIIDQYSPAKFTESTEIRLAFTHEAWAQLSDELSGKFLGKLLIGWYHSHPRMDVFLSSHDMQIQNERFSESWMVALVLEPEKHRGGFFCERDGRVSPNTPVEFFELLERNTRDSVLAWENYKAVDPSTSAEPLLGETNTATLSTSSSQEIQVARTARSKKVPIKGKPRRRSLLTLGLIALALGMIAVGVVNRTRIKNWIQSRTAGLAEPQPQPSPTVEPAPSQAPSQISIQPSASPQQQEPASSPTPIEPSASPTQQESIPKTQPTPAEGGPPKPVSDASSNGVAPSQPDSINRGRAVRRAPKPKPKVKPARSTRTK